MGDTMKKIICIFCSLLLSCSLFADIVLCRQKTTVPIIIPARQSAAEKTATEELVHYLEKITGSKFQVVVESRIQPDSAVYLGHTDFAGKAGLKPETFGKEEWQIKTHKGSLIITGGAPRGVLYGTYQFLENVLGVKWLSPYAEYVPRCNPLKTAGLDLRGKPAMQYREIYFVPGPEGIRFLARNRMNTEKKEYGGQMIFSRAGMNHTLYTNFGKKAVLQKMFKEHPEYFPLINGKRKADLNRGLSSSQTQFCLTNPGLRKAWVERLRYHIRKDREFAEKNGIEPPMFYAVDQNDSYDGYCQCKNCSALVKKEGAKSALLLDFTNFVARELEKEAPEAIFLMMALHSTEKAPKSLKPRKNVGIRLCDTTSNVLRSWHALENTRQRTNLRQWGKLCQKITVWDYQKNYGSIGVTDLPTPTAVTFSQDLQMLRANNGIGVFFEHEAPVTGDMRDLKVFLEIKMIENPDLKYEDLLKTFTDAYYGKAAGAKIRAYLTLLEKAAKTPGASVRWYPWITSYSFITLPVLLKANQLLDEARETVKNDKQLSERVEHAGMSLDKLYLLRYRSYQKQAQNSKLKNVRLPEIKKVRARYENTWKREMKRRTTARYLKSEQRNFVKMGELLNKQRELPVPAIFKKISPEALTMISINFAQRGIDYQKFVKDPQSPNGEALAAKMSEITTTPHKGFGPDKFEYPFHWAVYRTLDGDIKGKIADPPSVMPRGYHWYKLTDNVRLAQSSYIRMFAGFFLILDGVVNDNSELGQVYEIWASIKVTGTDCFKTGKPAADNVFYIDQFAVIRKTRNSEQVKPEKTVKISNWLLTDAKLRGKKQRFLRKKADCIVMRSEQKSVDFFSPTAVPIRKGQTATLSFSISGKGRIKYGISSYVGKSYKRLGDDVRETEADPAEQKIQTNFVITAGQTGNIRVFFKLTPGSEIRIRDTAVQIK